MQVSELDPSATLKLDAPGKVKLKGRVRSQFPLEKLEAVQDGRFVATGTLDADRLNGSLDVEIAVERSGWIALRASGPVVNRWPSRFGMRAHTNPVFIEVKNHPAATRAEAEYFLKWIDRLEADLKRRDQIPASELEHVRAHLAFAREYYQRRLQP